MGRMVLLAAVLSAVLASAQLAGDPPPPPEYQVKGDGTLVIGGDMVVSCFQVGQEDPYLVTHGPEARACEAAGFGTAADASSDGAPTPAASASALSETGGAGPAGARSGGLARPHRPPGLRDRGQKPLRTLSPRISENRFP